MRLLVTGSGGRTLKRTEYRDPNVGLKVTSTLNDWELEEDQLPTLV